MTLIRRAGPEDLLGVASFIETHNQNPSTQCLQSSTGERAENLAEELQKLHAAGELVYVLAEEEDRLLGVLGCEYAVSDARGWLRGPLIASPFESGPDGFPALASRLLEAVFHDLPPSIVVLDTFLNAENQRGLTFYASVGFQLRSHQHVYVASRPERPKPPRPGCDVMTPEQLPDVQALHSTVFSGLRSAEDTFRELDDHHRVWVYAPRGEVAGYVLAVVESWAEEGYIEFLGVRADARGQGVGAALLETALHWCFVERGVPQVGLTVDEGNGNARGLYAAAGFRLRHSGVNHRWEQAPESL
jgi:ribosomal-protein-alanine N-acetyltransferase